MVARRNDRGGLCKEWMEMGGKRRVDVMKLEIIRLKDTEGAVEEIGKKEGGEGKRREGRSEGGDERLGRVMLKERRGDVKER